MRARLSRGLLLLTVAVVGLTSVVPAFAQDDATDKNQSEVALGGTERTEAGVVTYAWYWRDQKQQKVTNPVDGTDIVTFELKNPYCPDTSPAGSPPEQACKPGRLPVEVRNDYNEPHKLSAVNFDLSLVPPDSKIKKFEVQLWEAQDEFSRSTQYNVGDHRIQACEVTDIFGEGEARLYSEKPKFKCTKSDASAQRKTVTVGKGDKKKELNVWTFDLTNQAKEWIKKEVFFTSVMLHPQEPKNPTPEDEAWQVVFAGPMEMKYGVDTIVEYVAPEIEPLPTIDPSPTTDPTETPTGSSDPLTPPSESTDFGSGSTTTTTTTGSSSPTTSTNGAASDDPISQPTGEDAAEDPTLAEGEDTEMASDEEKTVAGGLPLYVWLSILAGMAGFSMVRSVVLEKNTGIRPNGVLAQIQKLNAQRRGTAIAESAAGTSALGGMVAGLGAIGSKITSGAGKLGQLVSRKKG